MINPIASFSAVAGAELLICRQLEYYPIDPSAPSEKSIQRIFSGPETESFVLLDFSHLHADSFRAMIPAS